MNYLELKIAVLQKMFAITGAEIVDDDTTRPYLTTLPQAANEGIDLIVQSGRPVRASCMIHQVDTMPPEEALIEGDGYGVTRPTGVNRYDMEQLIGKSYRRVDGENVWMEDEDGNYAATTDYAVEAERYLLLSANQRGTWRVYAICIPEPVQITETTDDAFPLPLPKECCDILPLYIASQLYKDDDISMATIWRNEFNVALEMIAAQAEKSGGGSASFRTTTNWW